jgi:hypothetical protein
MGVSLVVAIFVERKLFNCATLDVFCAFVTDRRDNGVSDVLGGTHSENSFTDVVPVTFGYFLGPMGCCVADDLVKRSG